MKTPVRHSVLLLIFISFSLFLLVLSVAVNVDRIVKFNYQGADFQIADLSGGLDVFNTTDNSNIKAGGNVGVNNTTANLRLKAAYGLTISDVTVDMTADRSWSAVSAGTDRPTGKSFVSNLESAPGVAATHTLYVPVPAGRTSAAVFICPSAASLNDVSLTCADGISRTAGSYTESFGNIVVSLVNNLEPNVEYWKIEGLTGSGGMAYQLATFIGSGEGTSEAPYQVTSCVELQDMQSELGAYYVLANDIDCSASSGWNSGTGFLPVGSLASPFTGKLEGNSHTISGLYYTQGNVPPTPSEGTVVGGLFGYASGAQFTNINLNNTTLMAGYWAGPLVGYLVDGTVFNCNSTNGTVHSLTTGWGSNTGGLIGFAKDNSTISNSSAQVTLYSGDFAGEANGGFIGGTEGAVLIDNCHASGEVSGRWGTSNIGGFIGALGNGPGGISVIRNSSTSANVVFSNCTNSYNIGGFAGTVGNKGGGNSSNGENSGYIYSSSSTGAVTISGYWCNDIGGFTGSIFWDSIISDSYATGSISAVPHHSSIGGFAGSVRSDIGHLARITNSYATGNIFTTGSSGYPSNNLGGFIGYVVSVDIQNCYSTGNISSGTGGSIADAGGFAGSLVTGPIQISDSYTTGSIDTDAGSAALGGFVGSMNGDITIENSAALGNHVAGTSDPGNWYYGYGVGGFAGHAVSGLNINNCFTRVAVQVKGNTYAGGFIGNYDGYDDYGVSHFSNCYAANTLSTVGSPVSGSVGGFIGYSNESNGPAPVVTSSYWDSDLNGLSSNAYGTPLSTSAMKTQNSFSGWDFQSIWHIYPASNDGYPSFTGGFTDYACSGSCGSGSSCNQYGNPPEGKMWSCKQNPNGDYRCKYDLTNTGGDSCYLDCTSGLSACNCNINTCAADCSSLHANDNYGHYTLTETCTGCGQLFTCGCDIFKPSGIPTPTPAPGMCGVEPYPGCGGQIYYIDNNGNPFYTDDPDCSASTTCDYTYDPPNDFNVSYCAGDDGCDCWWPISSCSTPTPTPTLAPMPPLRCDSQSFCTGTHYSINSGGTTYETDDPDCAARNFCDYVYAPGDYLRPGLCGSSDGCDCFWESSWCVDQPPNPTGPVATYTPTPGPSATPTFTVSDTLTRLKAGVPSDHTITFNTINGLTEPSNTIVINMADWDISNLTVSDLRLSTDNTILSLDDTPGVNTWGVTFEAGVITLTAPTTGSGYISAGSDITLKIGIVASGINQPVNPESVGSYRIFVTNMTPSGTEGGMASIPIVDSDQVNITGYVNAFISFDIDTGTVDEVDCSSTECKIHGGIGAAPGDNYTVDLGELKSTVVNKSKSDEVMHSDGLSGVINSIYFDLSTNAQGGAIVEVTSASNNGLMGPSGSNITPVTDGNVIDSNSGKYGFNVAASDRVAGGTIVTNSSCNSVDTTLYCGPLHTTPKQIFNTSGVPIDTARVRMDIAAAATYTNTPGAYTDTLTFVATATF